MIAKPVAEPNKPVEVTPTEALGGLSMVLIPDDTYKKILSIAAARGQTVAQFIGTALDAQIAKQETVPVSNRRLLVEEK